MAILKLANGPITMTVAQAQSTPSTFDPEQMQVVLTSTADDRVYLSELTAMKQLARLNLTLESVIGKTIHMEQVKKDGRTYTNISLAGDSAAVGQAAPAAAPRASAPPPMDFDAMVALYAKCVSAALTTFALKCEEAGVPVDGSAVQASAATLFIRATK